MQGNSLLGWVDKVGTLDSFFILGEPACSYAMNRVYTTAEMSLVAANFASCMV